MRGGEVKRSLVLKSYFAFMSKKKKIIFLCCFFFGGVCCVS